jgi:type IV pilus assembly protein PilC
MAQFTYRAMDGGGKILRGNLDAVNALDLEMRLKRMSLDLITFRPASRLRHYAFGKPVKRPEVINFCFHMEQLLRSGVPIIEALTDLRDTVTHPQFREVIANVLEAIEGGKTFSDALADHARVFDDVFVALVRAGEASGQLPEVLARLTENLKWQDEIAAQTKIIMIYPSLSAVVVLVAVAVLLLYVVPNLAQALQTLQPEMSTGVKTILAVSNFLKHYWLIVAILPVLLIVGVVAMIRSSGRAALAWDAIKFKLPLIGTVMQKIVLARFSTFFALMYSSGVSILDCIRISEKITGNKVIEEGLARVGRAIAEGQGLTQGFQNVGLFPPLVLRMLRVGETTGALDRALDNVGYFYNRDVRESIAGAQQRIQPIMIAVLGGIFVLVLLPVIGPIYDAISKVKF